jgi:hypothetical protein
MIFRKKKRMIDIRELQKRGVVRIPKNDSIVPTNPEGFVEFGADSKPIPAETESSTPSSNTEFFGFMDSSSPTTQTSSSEIGREESERITELDNKIYKLENRIELLEKKLDVNQPADTPVGVMGW